MRTYLDQKVETHPGLELALITGMALTFLAHACIQIYHVTHKVAPVERVAFPIITVIFTTLVVLHALYTLGWRQTLAFFSLTYVISFGFEFVGATTGLIFGPYHYAHLLGPEWLHTVPMVIPLAYFMVLYPCHLMANLLLGDGPLSVAKGVAWALTASLLSGMVMTAWDLTMDPLMAGEVKAWIWTSGGAYFNIPFQNFIGWVVTTGTCAMAFRMVEPHLVLKPLGRPSRWILMLPLLGYGLLSFGDLFVGYPLATRVISPFVMGIPLLAATLRVFAPMEP
jgi:uncharacterized membrane protein